MEKAEKVEQCEKTKLEFMRKSRFESLKYNFEYISPEASKIIEKAEKNDILSFTITFSNPKILKAEIFDEKKFIELVF